MIIFGSRLVKEEDRVIRNELIFPLVNSEQPRIFKMHSHDVRTASINATRIVFINFWFIRVFMKGTFACIINLFDTFIESLIEEVIAT